MLRSGDVLGPYHLVRPLGRGAFGDVWLAERPNVVPVLEAEIYDGRIVIASEFVAGGSLEEWLRRHGGRAPSFEVAFGMMRGILPASATSG